MVQPTSQPDSAHAAALHKQQVKEEANQALVRGIFRGLGLGAAIGSVMGLALAVIFPPAAGFTLFSAQTGLVMLAEACKVGLIGSVAGAASKFLAVHAVHHGREVGAMQAATAIEQQLQLGLGQEPAQQVAKASSKETGKSVDTPAPTTQTQGEHTKRLLEERANEIVGAQIV